MDLNDFNHRLTIFIYRLIEQHNKSILVGLSIFISIGGWFLWNILFSEVYGFHAIYHVRDAFLHRFGTSILWWGTLVVIVVICTLFEVVVVAMRTTLWPTDVSKIFLNRIVVENLIENTYTFLLKASFTSSPVSCLCMLFSNAYDC